MTRHFAEDGRATCGLTAVESSELTEDATVIITCGGCRRTRAYMRARVRLLKDARGRRMNVLEASGAAQRWNTDRRTAGQTTHPVMFEPDHIRSPWMGTDGIIRCGRIDQFPDEATLHASLTRAAKQAHRSA